MCVCFYVCVLDLYHPCCWMCVWMCVCALLTCVQPHMHLHAAGGGEALPAVCTLEGFDARVCFGVCGECAFHSERSETLCALVRLLVRVYADVAHQVTRLLELLAAVWATMPAHSTHLPDSS